MPAIAIAARGLTKAYRMPAADGSSEKPGWIEAVADASFELSARETVGLIGRNGAGKSTLLKLLSRVTRPTAGHADTYGRVGALLEVGSGFHPELTGRENLFLSGAILGMSRDDVRRRFDEIVAFAEVPEFIDVPVKHYSSGMYARLGFSVAAFLKPDILIVDEILSVGDLSFQAKCLAHMRRLADDGTTVLFVSHNLLAMADFCSRSMVMERGRIVFDGPTTEAIAMYRQQVSAPTTRRGSASAPAHTLLVNGERAPSAILLKPNARLAVELEVSLPSQAAPVDVVLNLVIELPDQRKVVHLRSDLAGVQMSLRPGRNVLSVRVDDLPLAPGSFVLWLRVVGLGGDAPVIWDTDHLPLDVVGDRRIDAVVQPQATFAARH